MPSVKPAASLPPAVDARLARRLYGRSGAARWKVDEQRFTGALAMSLARAFHDRVPSADEAGRYLEGLHVEDLALACACMEGRADAWDHFVLQFRPALYRAADALDPSGGAREIADSLYADLYGLQERAGERRSLFGYFHGRSSLITWLRAVLAQRHVDRVRERARVESLPSEEAPVALPPVDPDRARFLSLLAGALARAVGGLPDRDRLRLSLYYRRQLRLAEVGRILGEHEATVSRQLARIRAELRMQIERSLGNDAGLSAEEVERCFASASEDAGPIDLDWILDGTGCKPQDPERSI